MKTIANRIDPDQTSSKQSDQAVHCCFRYMLLWQKFCSTFKIRPNKKISVFQVTGLKILGREGTHIYFF